MIKTQKNPSRSLFYVCLISISSFSYSSNQVFDPSNSVQANIFTQTIKAALRGAYNLIQPQLPILREKLNLSPDFTSFTGTLMVCAGACTIIKTIQADAKKIALSAAMFIGGVFLLASAGQTQNPLPGAQIQT